MPVLQALRNKWTPIGVDVGACGVRAVQARVSEGRYTIVAAAHCERPAAAEKEAGSAPADRLLADCLQKTRFRGRRAVSGVCTPEVEFHSLDLPAAALKNDADQVVRFEVERLMTDPPKDLEARHWTLPATSGSAPNALAVGVSHEAIQRVLKTCDAAGLVCSCVDTSATALARFAVHLREWPKGTVWGVLDLGGRSGRLVICVDECPVLVRTTGAGGRAWTQRIADALQLSFKAAEVHKRTHGIALTAVKDSVVGPGVEVSNRSSVIEPLAPSGQARSELASMLLGALRFELNDLAAEVKRSYEYVLSCYPNRKATDLVLVGGGAGLPNLSEHLAGALGIPVRRPSEYLREPGCRITFAESRREPMDVYAVATGLTMAD